MTTPYAGSNITGSSGLIAVDKVGNRIRFYDPESLREIKSFPAPEPAAHELAISHDRRFAFVPLYGDGIYGSNRMPNNKILVVDLAAQALADVIALGEMWAPHGMVAGSDGKLWVVCDIPNKLLRIDAERRAIEAAWDCPAKGAHQLAMLPDETKLYVSAKEGNLAAFDLRSGAFTRCVSLRAPGVEFGNGSGSEGVMPTADGRRLIAIDNAANDLRVIDTATDTEADRVPLAWRQLSNPKRSRLAKLMFSPDGRHLVVTAYAGGLAWVIDAADLARQSVVPVAKGPQGMAFPPDGRSVIVGESRQRPPHSNRPRLRASRRRLRRRLRHRGAGVLLRGGRAQSCVSAIAPSRPLHKPRRVGSLHRCDPAAPDWTLRLQILWTRRNTAVGKLVHPTMNSLFAVNKIAWLAHDARVPKAIRTQETEEGNDNG